MEVAVLTTRLEAQVAQFNAQMAAAAKQLEVMQKQMGRVEKTAEMLRKQLDKVKMDEGQAARTKAVLDSIGKSLEKTIPQAKAAQEALSGVRLDTSNASETVAVAAVEVRELKKIRDAAIEANLAQMRVQTRSLGGQFGRKAIPISDTGLTGLSDPRGMEGYRRYLGLLAENSGLGRTDFLASLRNAEGNPRRMVGRFGFDELPPNPILRDIPGLGTGDIKGAERWLRNKGFRIAGGNIGTRGPGGGGHGGGGGAAASFFRGILPGGRRAGAGAVLTGLGLLAGMGPAAVPAAGGLAVGAGAAMTGLLGTAATLKLAFADISAAAFSSKQAFDALTPVQKSFVVTLKAIDQGFTKPLERLAQRNLLPKFTDALHSLLSPNMMGALRTGVGSFANQIGGGAQDLGKLFGSSGFTSNLQKVLVANSRYVHQFIDDIGRLADAFFRVLKVGIPFTNWLSKTGVSFSRWVNDLTKTSAANGKMAQFFDHAKQGLQVIGGLLMSLIHVAGAFGDAFGFKNSIDLIGTFSRIFQTIADFIKQNRTVLHDFFAGAIKVINDVLSLLRPMLSLLSRILGYINKLAGGTDVWRRAIELLLGVLTAKRLYDWASGFGKVAAGEAAVGAAATESAGKVGLLRGAILALASPEVLAVLGPLAAIVGAGYGLGKLFDNNTATFEQLRRSKDPFAKWALGSITKQATGFKGAGQAPSILSLADVAQPISQGLLSPAGVMALKNRFETPIQYQTALTWAQQISGGGFRHGKAPGFRNDLVLPYSIHEQLLNASDGKGDMQKANAAAYAYYNKLLAQPGLSRAAKDQIKMAQSLFAPLTPFQVSGGGGVGFKGPTGAGGGVFNAQQAVQQAMVTGSGVSFYRQVQLARAYEASAARAYEHLKNQKVNVKDQAAKQAELNTLKKDQLQAEKYLTTIYERQANAVYSGAVGAIGTARGGFSSRLGAAQSTRQVIHATNTVVASLEKQKKILLEQAAAGKNVLKDRQEVQKIEAYITDAYNQESKAIVAMARAAIANARAEVQNATTYRQKLAAEQKLLGVLQAQEKVLRQQDASSKDIAAIHNSIVKAHHQVAQIKGDQHIAAMLGIGGGGVGPTNGPRIEEHLRRVYLTLIRRLYRPFGRRGVETNPFSEFPGATTEPVSKLIKQILAAGVQIPKSTLGASNKILDVIAYATKHHIKIAGDANSKIIAILSQMNDTLKTALRYPTTYHLASIKDIMRGLHGGGPRLKREIADRIAAAEIFHGRLPSVQAVAGLPVIAHHIARHMTHAMGPHARQLLGVHPTMQQVFGAKNIHPRYVMDWETGLMVPWNKQSYMSNTPAAVAAERRAQRGFARSTVGGIEGAVTNVTINIHGYDKNSKELAVEIRKELQKTSRRNTTQTRGPNAGKNLGMH
jgi:hypothetical protein